MLTLAIQAGGQSRRMGSDKALVQLGGKSLLEHILERLDGLGDETLITTNNPESLTYLGIRLESDPIPGAGALAGLHTALSAARGNHVLVIACDMPFVNRQLMEYMIGFAKKADVVVPQRAGYFEPLHAVYSRGCLPAIENALRNGHSSVLSFYDEVRVRTIDETELARLDPQGMSFFNINTPEDLVFAEDYLHQLSNT